jgi:rhamnulose-1-phosphate aldolase
MIAPPTADPSKEPAVTDLLAACPQIAPWLARMSEVSAYLWRKGWAERNAGNLSVDVTECVAGGSWDDRAFGDEAVELAGEYRDLAGRWFLVTGTGRRFRDLAGDAGANACALRLDASGRAFRLAWGGTSDPAFRPTSEFPAHLRVHEHLRRTNAVQRVVLHTHPTELVALTHLPEYKDEAALNRTLWSMHPEVKVAVPRGLGFVPYEVPGSEALALASAAAFARGHDAVLWEMHGAVAVGRDVAEAFDLIDTLNKAAHLLLLCRAAAGSAPEGLGPARVAELVKAFGLKE